MNVISMKKIIALALFASLAACSAKRELSPAAVLQGPDEFSTVTHEELVMPSNLSALPVPTLGGMNRADINPKADAFAALGGVLPQNGIDQALVSHSQRYGVDANIREALREADTSKLKRNRIFPLSWFKRSYEKVYQTFALNPHDEAERFEAMGIETPKAPQL